MKVKPKFWRRLVVAFVCLLVIFMLASNRKLKTWLPHRQARLMLAADQTDDARWWIDLAEQIGGDYSETTLYRARLARKAGSIEKARQYLDKAEKQGLVADRVARERILLRAQSGEVQDAQSLLPVLLQGSPSDSPEVCEAFALGFCKSHTSMRGAIALLNGWVVDYPEDPRPHLLLAELSLEVMDIDNALLELRRALRVAPTHGGAALKLGELTLQQQEPDEAMKLFQTAAHNKATRPAALVWQARCLRTVGRLAEAQTILDQAFEEAPGSSMGNIEQAYLEIAAGEFDAAAKRTQEVLEREPFRHEARAPLATAMRSLGQVEAAGEQLAIAAAAIAALVRARHLARDVAIDSDNVELRTEIGDIHLEYGDPRKALEWFESVLTIDPRHQPIRQTLDEFFESHPEIIRTRRP
jgi:tetratricopeptide (TPR) repeat protein